MSLLPALGSRQYPTSTTASRDAETTSAGKNAASAASALMNRTAQDAVSLSKNGIDLSAQGLAQRTSDLGNSTMDVAQSFIADFAGQLFGDAAKGATISFDSASLSAQSGYAAMLQHSEGSGGISDGAAFSLNESSHFIGKGTITTADGQSFEFEIEVQYESSLQAAATQTSSGADQPEASATDDSASTLPTRQLQDVAFPGTLNDLFKLLGQQLQSNLLSAQSDSANSSNNDSGGDQLGTLKLRLLNLINNPTTLASASPATPEQADAAARAKALAATYGTPAPAETVPQPEAEPVAPVADPAKPGAAAA